MKRLLIYLHILIIIPAILAILPAFVYADDTEIYGVTTEQVKPNVLIIFDNSGSMDFPPQ